MFTTEEKIAKDSQYFIYTPTAAAKALFLYPTVIGGFEYLPGYSLERNRYDSYLVILIENGTMEILLDGKYITAAKGDAILLDCYKPHAYRTSTGCKTLWLHFDGKLAGSYYEYLVRERGNIIALSNFKSSRLVLSKLLDGINQHLSLSEAQMSIMIGNLLLELSVSPSSEDAADEDGIKKVTSYLTENFSKKITLEDMADMAGLSPYHFNRKYKKETGVTPHQFLLSTRISAAKYNLSNSNMTISEIALSSGFIDESAFCYCFKKREGITPNEYRKNAIGSGLLS